MYNTNHVNNFVAIYAGVMRYRYSSIAMIYWYDMADRNKNNIDPLCLSVVCSEVHVTMTTIYNHFV